MTSDYNKNEGISLRKTHFILVAGAVIISVLMFYSTFHLAVSFQHLTHASEEQIELRKAARELMDALSAHRKKSRDRYRRRRIS